MQNYEIALIINPDVVLSDDALKNFFLTVKKNPNFGILARTGTVVRT